MQDTPAQSRIVDSGTDTVRMPQGERTATDVLRALEDGIRVVIDIDGFDGSMQATVRKKGDVYRRSRPSASGSSESRRLS